MSSNSHPSATPQISPVLDPGFQPAFLANRAYLRACDEIDSAQTIGIALEQADGSIFRTMTQALPDHDDNHASNAAHLERMLKFLLWSRGARRVHIAGPQSLVSRLQTHYRDTPTGRFDADIMGDKIYGQPFEIVRVEADELPEEKSTVAPLGRHLEGCRIGFDLGASDRKVAALKDGEVLFSEEVEWDPRPQTDPQWHFDEIMACLKSAADKLPQVDAIGGSSAGVLVNNQVRIASLFRGVPEDLFKTRVRNLFLEIKQAWNDIPFEIVNDGEVTALAGSMAINDNSVLGIAMGSSEALGYVNPDGNITTWLNELAFAPVDHNPGSAIDEWSRDYGCGAQYFSQQAVGKLIPRAGIEVPSDMPLPDQLKHVQGLMADGDDRARRIYQTIGTYLGYSLAHYADHYDYRTVLILGRVTTGEGGELIINGAKDVLKLEFPDLAEKIGFHIPDEKEKRHGQAIAAASLPTIPKS
jgi:predicted NBD/HSP70 family sugar kinase